MYKKRSRITTTIWATLLLSAGFGLWHILPDSVRNVVQPTAHAATLTVNTADDHNDGVCNAADCTLREAINAANAGDTISFNILGSGVHTINPNNGFSVTKALTIDGSSQPGFAGAPLIEINGAGAGAGVNALNVNAANVTIKSLIINRFSGYGISFDSFGNSSVQGCYIGTNAAGTAASANGAGGIRVNAVGVTVGGTASGNGNVISGNTGNGIDIVSGSGMILGNFIGMSATGNASISNTGDGVKISGSAAGTVGDIVTGARNIITGSSGIEVTGGSATIRGNYIGLYVSGSNGPGTGTGVKITGGSVTIGGTAQGAGNVIYANNVEPLPISDVGPDFGAAVYIQGGTGTVVQGNLIGTNSLGTSVLLNNVGILIDGAANNIVGGTSSAARNVISGNNVNIKIANAGATNNVIQGNFIGTDITGSLALGGGPVIISTGATNTLIGGTSPGARNVISGGGGTGIANEGGIGTVVQGNFIGLNSSGTASLGNSLAGVGIESGSATIGGTTAGAGNVISGNNLSGGPGAGIWIIGGAGSRVLGNFIGTNPAGTAKIGNRSGVIIDGAIIIGGAANNMIGGNTPAERNIISGNSEAGVRILNAGASSNVVQGNFIGPDVTGSTELGNGDGVQVGTGAQNNTIGGTATGAGNVISGNNGSGVAVTGGSGTSILGNFIGTNAAGTQGISNGGSGVNISGGAAVVGGLPGSRNVISGNNSGIVFGGTRPAQTIEVRAGVLISGGSGSQVVGNSIGTDASGTGVIPNDSGVVIEGAANNLIGVTTPAGGNVIKGNVFDGVDIEGPQATNNVVQSNLIASNGFNGVAISDGASNNRIGGTVLRAGNTITGNGSGGSFGSNGGGVRIDSGTGNAVLGNSIYSNALLGIDMDGSGVTANDNCESAVGPNINPQNFPVITSASADSTTTTIRGTLNSTANTQFRIEFFANAACDPSGNGEGQTFLGFLNTTTDASCNANFSFSFPNASAPGPIITATATDPNNNTSEFSACATPMGAQPTIQLSAASYTIGEGDKQVDIPITRSGDTSTAASVSFATSDLAGTQPCNVTIGVASSRCDYETRLATVSFAPGETSKTVSVSIMDDSYLEGPETFNVKLTNPTGAFIGAPSEVTVTITDNDLANGPNLIDAPGVFVRAHYLDFLNREPDQSGFDFWTNQITTCGSDQTCIQLRRINVSAAFFLSIEFQQTGYFVERIYKTAYGDTNGFSTNGRPHALAVPNLRFNQFLIDTQRISSGVIVGQSGWQTVLENNKRAYAMQIAPSAAYADPALTPAEFVDRLFTNAGFTPSTADRNAAIAEFGAAKDISDIAARARVLRDVADNPTFIQQEFNRAFVLMDYFGYLRRNPNDYPDSDHSGYDFWLTKLNQFNGDYQKAEMVKAFIASAEYRNRFGQP